ncbi:MAG: 4Fe-4S binding protein [Clostridiaceae bacterium]
MINISEEKIKELKGEGFILQNNKEDFICRVITVDGTLKEKEMSKIGEIADKYGYGHVSFTVRLTVEIPGIKYENIEKVKKELKEVGLYSGGTGNRVRPIVPCKGTVCTHGLIDTQKIGREVHERFYLGFYDMKLPHKFKIGIGGCPNNCIKPELNDFGIVGQRKPKIENDKCIACDNCIIETKCKMGAAKVIEEKIYIDFDKCNNCGKCIDSCHFGSISLDKEGVKIFLGGKWGKQPKIGEDLGEIYTVEEALDIIEKAIYIYKDQGKAGERFGSLIDRIGIENFK